MMREFNLGWFNVNTKEYEKDFFKEPYELLTMSGNISLKDNGIFPHIHVSFSGYDKKVIGGHLFSGTVCNTVELFIEKLNIELYRKQGEYFRPLIFK
ncbi:DUF296 domain-containing protein [Thermosipho ferrireducens]|uniref:DUF296 domain-containing protein n=2 Tax=Thermosipho ferrireducens TaxID=2571116 RepID=A0ABX7S7D9_9BACT|nr:DUF296 domain-containing protein [Thermosipho ferrireducens]